MLRILAGGATALLFSASSLALTPHEELVNACTESGNDPVQCSCAADVIIETLEPNEVQFMLSMMESPPESLEQLMSAAADHSMDMAAVADMRQKMTDAEPGMRERCGIEDDR